MQMADRICSLRCGWHHRALPAYEIPPAMPGDYYFGQVLKFWTGQYDRREKAKGRDRIERG